MMVLYFEVIINTIIYKVFIIAGVGLEKFDCSSVGAAQMVAWGRRRLVFTFGSEQLHSTESVNQSQTTIFVATNGIA